MKPRMPVLLVAPTFGRVHAESELDEGYPMGIGYLHACLERAGFEVRTLDCRGLSHEQQRRSVTAALARERPALIGFQLMTSQRGAVLDLALACKREAPGSAVIVGGPHAMVRSKALADRYRELLFASGEAERTVTGLAQALDQGRPFDDIPGLVFYRDGVIVDTGEAELVAELDELPLSHHDVFLRQGAKYASMMTSRGCPFACTFCAVARKKPRLRSIEHIVEEIAYIDTHFPDVRIVRLWDDQFFFRPERVIALCERIVAMNTRLRFTCLARLRPFSAELLAALEAAGFVEIGFGLETGSREVSLRNNKGIDPRRDATNCMRIMRDSPIRVFMFLMVGQPGEQWASIEETCQLCRELQAIRFVDFSESTGIATVYPGTELEALWRARSAVPDSFWEDGDTTPLFAVEHDTATLEQMHRYLLERADPMSLFDNTAMSDWHADAIPNLLRHVVRIWGTESTPHCHPWRFGKVINTLAQAVQNLTLRGCLEVTFANPSVTLSHAQQRGTAFASSDESGQRFVSLAASINPGHIVADFLRWTIEEDRTELFDAIVGEFARCARLGLDAGSRPAPRGTDPARRFLTFLDRQY